MPKMMSYPQQHLQAGGRHNNWLAKKAADRQQQAALVRQLATRPGRHSGNCHRHDAARAAVQLLAILSTVHNGNTPPAVTGGQAGNASTSNASAGNRIPAITVCRSLPVVEPGGQPGLRPGVINPVSSYLPLAPAVSDTATRLSTAAANATARARIPRSVGNPQPVTAADRALSITRIRKEENRKLIHYLRQNGALDPAFKIRRFSKPALAAALAGWLFGPTDEAATEPRLKIQQTARHILAAADLYGGRKGESLSHRQAEAAIRNWLFMTILGAPASDYLIRKIATDSHPSYFTISSIEELFSLQHLNEEGYFNRAASALKNRDFHVMWFSYLKAELPVVMFSKPDTRDISLHSQEFSDLYTGCRFLADNGVLSQFNQPEVQHIGRTLWEIAINQGVEMDKLPYFLLPALIFMALHHPLTIHQESDLRPISALAIENYLRYRKAVAEAQRDLMDKYDNYTSAVGQWLSKGKLADKIIAACPGTQLLSLPDLADDARSPQQKRKKAEHEAKQWYLNGIAKPCSTAPPSLGTEYQRLTDAVARHFYHIDKYLIWAAISTAPHKEVAFIRAATATIHPVIFTMRTHQPIWVQYGHDFDKNFAVPLNKTDLFSVTVGAEERIYALKGSSDSPPGRYILIRVDRHIAKYIAADLLKHPHFGHHQVTENRVITDTETFSFSLYIAKHTILQPGEETSKLVDYLSNLHRNTLYQALYASGNDQSDFQKVWRVIKHIVPFYDCIEGIVNSDPAQAIPACLQDALAFIPLLGQAANLGSKFGLGLSKGLITGTAMISKGSAAAAGRAMVSQVVLPTVGELSALGLTSLRGLDPGFELLAGAGNRFTAQLMTSLRQQEKQAVLAEKLLSSGLPTTLPAPSGSYLSARLPHSEISVPVKSLGQTAGRELYALFSPDSGELAGRHYWLSAGQLELARPADARALSVNPPNKQAKKALPLTTDNAIRSGEMTELSLTVPVPRRLYIFYHNPHPFTPSQPTAADNRGAAAVVQPGRPLPDFIYAPLSYDPEQLNIDLSWHREVVYQSYFPQQWSNIEALEFTDNFQYLHELYSVKSRSYLHPLSAQPGNIPPQFTFLRQTVFYFSEAVQKAKFIASQLGHWFNQHYYHQADGLLIKFSATNAFESYMRRVLDNPHQQVMDQAVSRFKFYLDRINSYFEDENYLSKVYLATAQTSDIPSPVIPGSLGFTFRGDPHQRIVIMADRFADGQSYNNAVHLTALHEVSHISGGTLDFFTSPYTARVGEPEDITEAFIEQLEGKDQCDILQFDDHFLQAYAEKLGIATPSPEVFRGLILQDPMLRANIILDNADTLATIISDFYSLLHHPRQRRQQHPYEATLVQALFSLVAGRINGQSFP